MKPFDRKRKPRAPRRLRSGLRRHGLVPRPAPLRALVREHQLRFTEGNRVEFYDRGRAGLIAMLEAIRSARRRIHLETYILRADTTGRRFLDALAGRARAGVTVRLLYDAFGSLGIDDSAFEPLRAAGADVVAFNPMGRLYPRWAPRRRDHRKILSVDGACAFTGGLNIGDEYWGEAGGQGWRDTHVRIEGPAVRDLEAVFLESWFRADGPDLPWQELMAERQEPIGGVRCAVLADGPAYRRRRTLDLFVAGLRGAASRVRLASPYFAPGRKLLDALGEAGRRGVAVDLMLAGKSDHPVLRRAARSFLPRLLACGVRVQEYEATVFHAKVALFDEEWAIVGTSNLDRQSFEHGYEVNLVLEGEPVAERVRAMFEADAAASGSVDEAALETRGFLDRILDRLAALLLRFI